MATTTRSPIQQRLFDEGAADARARRPRTAPEGGAELAKAYNDGFDSVPAPTTGPAQSKRTRPAGAKATSSSSSSRRTPAKKRTSSSSRRRPASRVPRQVQSNLVRPVERNVISGLTMLATSAAIAFAFNLLRNAETTATVIDRLVAGVKWLDSVDPIPYRTN